MGGTAADVARAIDLDSGENVYITGVTWNTAGYPTTEGAFDQSYNGLEDAFVTKLNSSGTGLIYSTYLGGNAQDVGNDIEVDSGGNAYIVGMAVASPGHAQPFPTTEGSFDVVDDGGQQGFLTKLTPAGDQLVYSTFLSANGTIANAVAVDGNGSTFVTGTCGFFPTTEGAYDETQNGFADAFVAKLENDGSDLIFSTYVGGGGTDWGMSIEIDPVGQAYVSGSVKDAISLDFPTTPGGFDTSQGGAQDAFFLIISNDGVELAYSTFLGGVQNEESNAIALTAEGDPVVAGITSSAGYPVSVGAFDETFGGGTWDVFVTKFGTPISPSATSPFDFDGDGATDVSVFRPNSQPTAQWWLLRSSDSGTRGLAFGTSTDVPVAADFTGDGKTDVAFWRPSSGEWFILRSEDDSFFAFPFGANGDIPAPGDFDGDGKADPAVYRP
ncbi:MAG: SBBP repeat-containing protein, partial [Aridibacter famidurans]|nr:SBBP repeat-containing protein [Aridibacter famidurans]